VRITINCILRRSGLHTPVLMLRYAMIYFVNFNTPAQAVPIAHPLSVRNDSLTLAKYAHTFMRQPTPPTVLLRVSKHRGLPVHRLCTSRAMSRLSHPITCIPHLRFKIIVGEMRPALRRSVETHCQREMFNQATKHGWAVQTYVPKVRGSRGRLECCRLAELDS
jgi:hypothetical protein